MPKISSYEDETTSALSRGPTLPYLAHPSFLPLSPDLLLLHLAAERDRRSRKWMAGFGKLSIQPAGLIIKDE